MINVLLLLRHGLVTLLLLRQTSYLTVRCCALGVKTGKWKTLQRSVVALGQVQETLRRASKMARDEWKYAWQNPEAAMARGRADYDFSDTNKDFKQTLADFEEMEELSETMSPGRKALWNATKRTSYWNAELQ